MRSVEWLAGLLEGEGCFTTQRYTSSPKTTPLLTLVMTDYDVVDEAKKLLECIGGRSITIGRRVLKSGKTAYFIYLTGLPAAKNMMTILPFMGERRALKIRTILAAWTPKKYRAAVQFKTELQGLQEVL